MPKAILLGDPGESYLLGCGNRMIKCRVGVPVQISEKVVDRIVEIKKNNGSPMFKIDFSNKKEVVEIRPPLIQKVIKKEENKKNVQNIDGINAMKQMRFETWL